MRIVYLKDIKTLLRRYNLYNKYRYSFLKTNNKKGELITVYSSIRFIDDSDLLKVLKENNIILEKYKPNCNYLYEVKYNDS